MRDPYLYPDSDVLKNLAEVQDLEELKIRQVILWNRKEKREHLPEEIREMASLPEK